jgi:hypothetical protein
VLCSNLKNNHYPDDARPDEGPIDLVESKKITGSNRTFATKVH